tara:strand:+ start:162 stop:431 length:270 start_codon:yes stop_codon:yes gene_type:complete
MMVRDITVNDIAFNDTLDIPKMGVFNCDAVTDKAVCISVPTLYSENKAVWLPKSQITISEVIKDDSFPDWKRLVVILPQWLINKTEGDV